MAINGKVWLARDKSGKWWYDNVPFDQPSWPAGPYDTEEIARKAAIDGGYDIDGVVIKGTGW